MPNNKAGPCQGNDPGHALEGNALSLPIQATETTKRFAPKRQLDSFRSSSKPPVRYSKIVLLDAERRKTEKSWDD